LQIAPCQHTVFVCINTQYMKGIFTPHTRLPALGVRESQEMSQYKSMEYQLIRTVIPVLMIFYMGASF